MSTIRIGDWEFDQSRYDAEADVLYVTNGGPRPGYGEETPEGHILRFDEEGALYGVTLIGARRIMEECGRIAVTLPSVPSRELVELHDGDFEYA